ncbi:MAG TPA: hypothetical protein VGB97_00330 [Candidatus Paceibacterota bacterium]|jgi:hypothetical protein
MQHLWVAVTELLREYRQMKKSTLIIIVAGVVALGAAGYLSLRERQVPVPELPDITREPAPEMLTYSAPEAGITFSYSPGYYLKERKEGAGNRPELVVVLVEDTTENREVIDGRSTTAREGPTSITLDVYPNPDRLGAEDWVRADTNWTVRTSDAAPIGRGSITGVTYSWDGLYSGKTVVVTRESRAYVFSVTWMSPEDPILKEFDRVLESVVIAAPES